MAERRDRIMDHTLEFKSAWMHRQVDQAQSMYQRVLVAWASDVLELRRTGRSTPTWGTAPSLGFASAEFLHTEVLHTEVLELGDLRNSDLQDNLFDEPMNDAA